MTEKEPTPTCGACEEELSCGTCEPCESDHCDDGDCIQMSELRTCGRVSCGFRWVYTGGYIDCPICELKEAKEALRDAQR